MQLRGAVRRLMLAAMLCSPVLGQSTHGSAGDTSGVKASATGTGGHRTGERRTFALPNGAGMEFVWIEPGTYLMGTSEEQEQALRRDGMWDDWSDMEQPQHQVTVKQGFWLARYELTQGQWAAAMGTRPWSGKDYVQSNPSQPAVYISWGDAREMVSTLNRWEGRAVYRLPTEAEWEYARRAGTTTRWSFGDVAMELGGYGWYERNALDAGQPYAHPVGTKLPNRWGLYDMHGNVAEWVQDRYGSFPSAAQVDPQGPASSSDPVVRGGAFGEGAQKQRSASRSLNSPGHRGAGTAVRLLRTE